MNNCSCYTCAFVVFVLRSKEELVFHNFEPIIVKKINSLCVYLFLCRKP